MTSERQKILIVDDRPENLFAMKTVLEDIDVEIIEANSGEDALWNVLKNDFALIILDVQMPKMDGFETAKLLKNNEKTKYIPIIFVTAINKEKTHVFKGYESGAVDYIFKPLEPKILVSKVNIFMSLDQQKGLVKKEASELKSKSQIAEKDRDKFVNILNTMGNGVCIINKNYGIEYINPIIEKEFGKYEGQECFKYFHSKDSICSCCKIENDDSQEDEKTEFFFPKNNKTFEMFSYPIKNTNNTFSKLIVFYDITERKKIEDEIRHSLEEKELLMKEIHHRVKNNLMIVSSLLSLQSQHIKDEVILEMFKESQNRIKSMSIIHEHLYKSADLININFKIYIENLTKYIVKAYETDKGNITLKTDVDETHFNSKTAIYCGLIITELVSNCLKYAFNRTYNCMISVSFHTSETGKTVLIVKDNGKGLPADFDCKQSDSFGLQLVTIFAEKNLNGKIDVNGNDGTEFKITFTI